MLTQSQTGWSTPANVEVPAFVGTFTAPLMRPELRLVEALASAFLAGELTVEGVIERGTRLLGPRWRWLPPLARRYVSTFTGRIRPRRRDVVDFLVADKRFSSVLSKFPFQLKVEHWLTEPLRMQPMAAAAKWDVPPIESVAALAQWLGTDINYLQWFADLKGLGSRNRAFKLRHYHYRVLFKDPGNIRLIEAPKQALKRLQQRILTGILDKVPAHPATHGFVRGRSIKTFVVPHVGQRVVLRMDLRDFFPTFRAARIRAFFRTLGYPEPVADLLAGMCTTATPKDIWKEVRATGDPVQFWETKVLYSRTHLPQGAPTSPALANLCAFRLDCRLTGLAASAGVHYTRYADDLAFSGNDTFARHVDGLSIHVAAILMEKVLR